MVSGSVAGAANILRTFNRVQVEGNANGFMLDATTGTGKVNATVRESVFFRQHHQRNVGYFRKALGRLLAS